MKELNSYDINNLVKEAQLLVGGKIDNIYQTDPKNLYLQIYIKDKPKQLLRISAGKAFFLTKNRPEFNENMQRFCSYLRKYLINSRITGIVQEDYERIIRIALEIRNESYELYAEFFGKGNIIFSKNNSILSVSEDQVWADRTLKSGQNYVYPKREDTKEMFEKFKKQGSAMTMQFIDEEFSKEQIIKAPSVKQKEMKKIETIIEKQTEQLNKLLKEIDENKRKGELIYENHAEIKGLLSEIEKSKSKNYDDIKRTVKSKLLKDIKQGKLILEIEK